MVSADTLILEDSEYDLHSASKLRHELAQVKASTMIDFRNVTFLDSTAIRELIIRLRAIRQGNAGAALVLKNLSPNVRRVFELTGLNNEFRIEPPVDERASKRRN